MFNKIVKISKMVRSKIKFTEITDERDKKS